MTLNKTEQELLKEITKERKSEIKEFGEYSGYGIPKNHPDNGLTSQQKNIFKKLKATADSLVKKKVLTAIQDDRRIIAYDLAGV